MHEMERQLAGLEAQLEREMARGEQMALDAVRARDEDAELSNAKARPTLPAHPLPHGCVQLAELQAQVTAARNEARERAAETRAKEHELRAKEQEMRVRDQDLRTKDHELAQLGGVREECRRMQSRMAEMEREHLRARDATAADMHKQASQHFRTVPSCDPCR